MTGQFIIPIYTSLCLFHAFAFTLGLAHSYDVDSETRAAPLTWWWFIFLAGTLFTLSVLVVYGVFIGGIVEKQPVWLSTPLEFHTIVIIALFLGTPATYRLGWLSGLALQHRIPPVAFAKLPVEIRVPFLVVEKHREEERERKGKKTNSVLDMLKVSMR